LGRRHSRATCATYLKMRFLVIGGMRTNLSLATLSGWKTSSLIQCTIPCQFLRSTETPRYANEPRGIDCFLEKNGFYLRHNGELVKEITKDCYTLATRHSYGDVAIKWSLDQFQRECESGICGEAKIWWQRRNLKVLHRG
jgi:hypothetical protein